MQKILFNNIDTVLPTRSSLAPKEAARMNEKEKMVFCVNSITEDRRGNKYGWQIFANLRTGQKICIRIDSIPVYFHVRVHTKYSTAQSFVDNIKGISPNGCSDFKILKMRPSKEFSRTPIDYVKITCTSLAVRKVAIDIMRRRNYQTASDDLNYLRMIARTNKINIAGWNYISSGLIVSPETVKGCDYVINAPSIEAIMPVDSAESLGYRDMSLVMAWDIETYTTDGTNSIPSPYQYMGGENNKVARPKGHERNYKVYMINSVFCWGYSDAPILDVCCVCYDSNVSMYNEPENGCAVTIICRNEEEVLRAHMMVASRMAPDIMVGYNTSFFDWPIILDAAEDYEDLFDEMLYSFSCVSNGDKPTREWNIENSMKFKLTADTLVTVDKVMKLPGIIDVDAKLMLDRKYPRENSILHMSLNNYLRLVGLEVKVDLPYELQALYCKLGDLIVGYVNATDDFDKSKIYHHNMPILLDKIKLRYITYVEKIWCDNVYELHRRMMAQIAYYCKIDSLRVAQLMLKDTIMFDARELSSLSSVPIYESIWGAIGIKVKNYFAKTCHDYNYAYSSYIDPNAVKSQFEGGYVADPVTGLDKESPISGLDFSSLYPSVIRNTNLAENMIIDNEETMKKMVDEGYEFTQIGPFEYADEIKSVGAGAKKATVKKNFSKTKNTKTVWAVKHNGVAIGEDGKSNIITHYKKIIMASPSSSGGKRDIKIAEVELLKNIPHGPEVIETSAIHSARNIPVPCSLIADGWDKRKVIYEPVYGRKSLPGECMGVMGHIMDQLINLRVPLKKSYVALCVLVETVTKEGREVGVYNGVAYSIQDLMLMRNAVNSKQLAIKVLANSFYGEAGNFRSSIYNLCIAAGTTEAGRNDIKSVRRFCESLSFVLKYGDTDSIYLSIPTKYIDALNTQYNLDAIKNKEERVAKRIELWTKKVALTMKEMNILVEEVNDFLTSKYGTLYMRMAYEEVGFPSLLCGKKKYCMIAHVEEINFHPKEYFMRGLDMIKAGKSGLTVHYGNEFVKKILSPEYEGTPEELAFSMIDRYKTGCDDDIEKYFMKEARYKEDKQNIAVKTFVKRMVKAKTELINEREIALADKYMIPENGEKFKYVVCKSNKRWKVNGNVHKSSVGEQMELLDVFMANRANMELDRMYYFDSSLMNMFARFLSFRKDLYLDGVSGDDKLIAEYNELNYSGKDNKIITAIANYLLDHYNRSGNETDEDIEQRKRDESEEGRKYKAFYKRIMNQFDIHYSCYIVDNVDKLLPLFVRHMTESILLRSGFIDGEINDFVRIYNVDINKRDELNGRSETMLREVPIIAKKFGVSYDLLDELKQRFEEKIMIEMSKLDKNEIREGFTRRAEMIESFILANRAKQSVSDNEINDMIMLVDGAYNIDEIINVFKRVMIIISFEITRHNYAFLRKPE